MEGDDGSGTETEDSTGLLGDGADEDVEDETHRSTLENGLCPGDFLLPEPPASIDADGAGAGAGAGVDFGLAVLTPGPFAGWACLLVLGAAPTGLPDLGEGGVDEEPKRRPARRRSERSSRGLAALDGGAADGPGDAHLWASG